MEVYLELVLFNNFAIDLLLIYWSLILLGRRALWWRLVLAAAAGAGIAAADPYMTFPAAWLVKSLVPFFLCLLAARPLSIKKYLTLTAFFVLFTVILGGAVYALFYLGQTRLFMALDVKSSALFGAIAVLSLIITYFSRLLAYKYRSGKRKNSYECEVEISLAGKTVTAKGYFDSGNLLYTKSYSPVVFLDPALISADILEAKSVKREEVRLETVGGKNKLPAYRLEKLKITAGGSKKTYDDVCACVSQNKMGDFQVLLHSDF
jgi:stage II sporulation protein GA (sporulation sigma-E factor processing peptidase)